MKMAMLTVYVIVDNNGNYGVGRDAASARSNWKYQDQQKADNAVGLRCYKMHLTVPIPVEIGLSGEVLDEGGDVRLQVIGDTAKEERFYGK